MRFPTAGIAEVSPERTIRQLVGEQGIADQSLRNWVKQAEIARGEREGLTTEEPEEFRRPRRENKILRECTGIWPPTGYHERRVARRQSILPSSLLYSSVGEGLFPQA